MLRTCLAVVAAFAAVALSASAEAADPIAEELFQQGRSLLDEGRLDEACPKLAESQRREPLSGTLITLGHCHEKQGKTATAWGEYRRAVALAMREDRPAYRQTAEQFAAAVEPRLVKLRLVAVDPPPGVDVILDEQVLGSSSLGTALPVDPGEHRVGLRAEGYAPHEQRVRTGAEGTTVDVRLPSLQALPAEAPPAEAPVSSAAGAVPAPASPPPAEPGASGDEGGIPIWAWVAGGTGLALLAVSAAFFADQRSAAGAIEAACGPERDECPPSDEFDFEAEHAREKRSGGLFIGFGVGGIVGVGAGIIGIVVGATSHDDPPVRAWLPPGDAGLGLELVF